MSSLHDFLARATQKASDDLMTAFMRLPEDKRNWKSAETARSAADMVAECALLNGATADLIVTKKFPDDPDMMNSFMQMKTKLAEDLDGLQSLLKTNTAKAIATLQAVPDEDLDIPIQLPWAPSTVAQIMSYPFWNMSYHEGQINYIASMLGCLD